MKRFKAIFFDLDHTLWDFDTNSAEVLAELFHHHRLNDHGISGEHDFIKTYREINRLMWDDYDRNQITKEVLRTGRFKNTLERYGIIDCPELCEMLASQYLERCPVKKNLLPGTVEILEYLSGKYSLHIITNGFREVQKIKIKSSGLDRYFQNIHISEEIGFRKPAPEIFHYAVKISGTVPEQCVMVGDNLETDIAGAENAGILPVFFNPGREKTERKLAHEIFHLEELRSIL